MGRATIISAQGDGLYTVQPVYDLSQSAAQIAALQSENSAMDTRLAALVPEISDAEQDVDFVSAAVHAAVVNGDSDDEVKELQEELNKARLEHQRLTSQRSNLKLKKTRNEKRISFLQSRCVQLAQRSAWCADYTDNLTGDVGTIEVGRRDGSIIIRPGYTSAAFVADDGQVQPIDAATPAAAFYNAAMRGGANRWSPRYRTGTITAINGAFVNVDLAATTSTHQNLESNAADSLSNVPVSYMDCDIEAFNVGDAVVIEFTGQSWLSPVVIGFVSNPVECDLDLRLWGEEYPLKDQANIFTTSNPNTGRETTNDYPLTWTLTMHDPTSDVPVIEPTGHDYSMNLKLDVNGSYCGTALVEVTDSGTPDPQTDSMIIYMPDGEWVFDHFEINATGTTWEEALLDIAEECCVHVQSTLFPRGHYVEYISGGLWHALFFDAPGGLKYFEFVGDCRVYYPVSNLPGCPNGGVATDCLKAKDMGFSAWTNAIPETGNPESNPFNWVVGRTYYRWECTS